MIQEYSKVKLNFEASRILTDSMREWMKEHRNRIFTVERIGEESIKLFKVDFWITKDLLQEVKM